MGRAVELVGIQVAQYFLGMDSEQISEVIEEGKLIWVWDFASRTARHRRCLRFWAQELHARPEGRPYADPRDVISKVIGPTPSERQRSSVIEVRWSLSPQRIHDLVNDGELVGKITGHTRHLTRRSMESLLLDRLVR